MSNADHDVLYVSADGRFRSSASYSARKDFKFCPKLFQLTRIEGWRSKKYGASTFYGNAIEAAVQFHIEHKGTGGVERFVELWEAAKDEPNFEQWRYSKTEASWENLLLDGIDHLKLFTIKFPSLPLTNAQFQVPLRKHIFPGTTYGKLTNTAYLDILCGPPEDQQLIDVKTMGKELREELVALDPQLIEYAWMLRKQKIGFLWFTKKGRGFKGGSKVYLLVSAGSLLPGERAYVLEKQNEWVYVASWDTLKEYEAAFVDPHGKPIKGKAADSLSHEFLKRSDVYLLAQSDVTKQGMQFATATVDEQDVKDMGQLIGRTTVEMVVAHETQFYPKDPGIRYPAEKCNTCYMRYICSKDTAGRDANLTRTGEEWLDVELDEEQD